MADPTDPSPAIGPRPADEPRRVEGRGAEAMLGWLKRAARRRQLRQGFFDPSLSVDPAWDVLIELAIARLEGRTVIVQQLIDDISGANPRWLRVLVEKGYCETDDAAAATAASIRLTARGWDEMRRYVQAAGDDPDRD